MYDTPFSIKVFSLPGAVHSTKSGRGCFVCASMGLSGKRRRNRADACRISSKIMHARKERKRERTRKRLEQVPRANRAFHTAKKKHIASLAPQESDDKRLGANILLAPCWKGPKGTVVREGGTIVNKRVCAKSGKVKRKDEKRKDAKMPAKIQDFPPGHVPLPLEYLYGNWVP